MAKNEDTLEPLAVSGPTARRILDIGTTKFHELVNAGVLVQTFIGDRPSITYESIKAAVKNGVSARRRPRAGASLMEAPVERF